MRLIALGFACNNACIFCAQGELRAARPSPREGEDDAARIDAQIAAILPGETVAFMGGEPTLVERLPSWIQAASARGAARILVQTNARRLAYAAYARGLREASPRLCLDVSLHGSTEPMHDYHTSTPGSFRQTVIGLRNARAAGIDAAVTAVITRSNFRHLAEIAAVAHGAGASAIRFAPAERFGSAARAVDRVVPALELVAPYLARAVVEARRLGLAVVVGDAASAPDARDRFAGLGQVEEVTVGERAPERFSPGAAAPAPRRVALKVLGRPAPGKQEVRAQVRRTGDDLKTIFPDLFGGPGGGGGAGGAG